eukprot:Protomagalhaensia_wolfi_Nauph_80__6080@NODE_858_length_1943_cov_21_753151_g646_i0_p2_GENE_NODE_858_length_1943_cov_21_753151_g646_i0NODE_858_length_1943_cov_21_753151_g646_i0_p2_ORF_typecomplete_len146_score13_52DUF1474/PF07342_11/0_23_NODE_858_length_1943_cov_21_753151_g646_i014661903
MWKLVSTAVKEFSLALQDPANECDEVGDIFPLAGSPFAEALNVEAPQTSPESAIVSESPLLEPPPSTPLPSPAEIERPQKPSPSSNQLQEIPPAFHKGLPIPDDAPADYWMIRKLTTEVEVLKSRLDQAHTQIALVGELIWFAPS